MFNANIISHQSLVPCLVVSTSFNIFWRKITVHRKKYKVHKASPSLSKFPKMQMLMTSLHEVIRFVSILELSDEKIRSRLPRWPRIFEEQRFLQSWSRYGIFKKMCLYALDQCMLYMVTFTINIPQMSAYIYQHHGSCGLYFELVRSGYTPKKNTRRGRFRQGWPHGSLRAEQLGYPHGGLFP
jgi:hypothetical protein